MATSGGEARKTVSVLFCDLTGSTALGERLDPESLRAVIQRYFEEMRAVVERHGGTIEKFIGDAVMAVFGVPRVHEDDALRAVRAAADMQAALTEGNARLERDFGTRIHARIGVNTGEVIAGDPSSGQSFVSGDAVNVAARLEQAAGPGEVLLGASTYRLVRAAVIAEPLPSIDAKGKSEPLAVYRLVVVEPEGQMLPRRLDAPLAGRRGELAVLRAAFDATVADEACRLVTIVGEAGIGKSRLALELLRVVGGDARILRGRCLPYGEGITFWPVTEVLEEAAGIQPGDSPETARTKLSMLLPEAQRALGDRLGAVLGVCEAAGAIQETFLAVRACLESLAATGPLVVVFDDIQWGEDAFLDLVQYLATFARRGPLLVVCLARPELLESRPDWTRLGESLRLEPLDGGAGADLVANLLGAGAGSSDVASTIVGAASGNPLFIEEMLRMLVDQGMVSRSAERWVLSHDVGSIGAPDTVQAVIAARLDRLEPGERTIVQIAAVVGEVFWWSAVAELAEGEKPVDVARWLQALVRKDLIRPDPSTFFSDDAFRFGHLLIRDVAYESLPKRTRAGLHERFARWVEERAWERGAEYDEIIGYHAERAYAYLTELAPADEHVAALAASAAKRLGDAGRRASDRGDLSAAINLLSRAVALYPRDDPGRPPLLALLGDALVENGRFADAEPILEEAIESARFLGDRRLELRASTNLTFHRFYHRVGRSHAEFLALIEPAGAELAGLADDAGLAEMLRVKGIIHSWGGRLQTALTVFEEGVGHARLSGERRLELELKHWMFVALTEGPTPATEAAERIGDLMRGNEDDRTFWGLSRRFLAGLHAIRGRFDEAHLLLREGHEIARELGQEVDIASGQLRQSAFIAMLAGDPAAAEADLRRAVETLTRIGDLGHLASIAPELALVLLSQTGREQEALDANELGTPGLIDDDVDAKVRWLAAKGRALSRLGDVVEGERLVRESVERAWRTDYVALQALAQEALAEVLSVTGRGAEAADALRKAIEVHEAKGNVVAAAADRRGLADMQARAGDRNLRQDGVVTKTTQDPDA